MLLKLPAFKTLKQEAMESILDRFDARKELGQGDALLRQGEPVRFCCCVFVVLAFFQLPPSKRKQKLTNH